MTWRFHDTQHGTLSCTSQQVQPPPPHMLPCCALIPAASVHHSDSLRWSQD